MFKFRDHKQFYHYDNICHKAVMFLFGIAIVANVVAVLSSGADLTRPPYVPIAMVYVILMSILIAGTLGTWAWASHRRRKYYYISK